MKQRGNFCNMKKKNDTEEYITEALFLLMEKREYSSISITDISKKAGVSRISFYRNFTSKDEVLKRYLEKSFKDWKTHWEESGDTNIAYQIFKFFDEQRRVIQLLYQANLQFLLIDHILLACGYQKGGNKIECYAKSTVAYIIFGWCNEWYLQGMNQTPEEMVKLFEQANQSSQIS